VYLDVDMVNAHFKIADELFNKNTLQFPDLHDYIVNRNMYLDTLGKHFAGEGYCDGLDYKKPNDYDCLKTCFIRILYFGDFKSWVKEMNLPPLDPQKFLLDLKKEFDKMADLTTEANPHFAELFAIEKEDNEKGTIVSWFLQEYERRILEQMFDFFHRSKQIRIKGCVLFDGIMIPLNDKTKDPAVVTKLLHACEAYILKHTGFYMGWIFMERVCNRPQMRLLPRGCGSLCTFDDSVRRQNVRRMYQEVD